MLPLPPHFHPLQALWPSLFTPSALSLPSQQLAESLFDVAGFVVFATLYTFAISFVFPCPPHQPLMLGKSVREYRGCVRECQGVCAGMSALAARPDSVRVLPPEEHPRIYLGSLPRPPSYTAAHHPDYFRRSRHSNKAITTSQVSSLQAAKLPPFLLLSLRPLACLKLPDLILCLTHSTAASTHSLFSPTPFSFPYPTPDISPLRALIPPLYNARRMFSLYKWLAHSAAAVLPLMASSTARAGSGSVWRLVWLGTLLACAVTNYLLWAYNIFCFLLPTVVPRIFEQDIASRAAAGAIATRRVEAADGISGSKGNKGGKTL
ncbi:unnamed protein product [Closterium sp. Yama58-4]|nr:unnamed protein product [Closterium sp. Yama58-4]